MKHWIVYKDNGEINRTLTGSEPITQELDGMSFMEGVADSKAQYVNNGVISSRPAMNIAYPATVPILGEAVISNIPLGATLSHPGGEETINDGQAEWSSLSPGRFNFTVDLFPYIPEAFSIEVTTV